MTTAFFNPVLGSCVAVGGAPAPASAPVACASGGFEVDPLFNPTRKYSVDRPAFGYDEKLLLEGGKVKFATEARQILAEDQGGVIVDYLRFTVLKDRLLQEPFFAFKGSDLAGVPEVVDEALVGLLAVRFAELLGYVPGVARPGRDYYEYTFTIENAFGHEVASVSGGGVSQRDTFCFTLKGEGCTFALPGWEKRVHDFFLPLYPKVTRIDLARDCWDFGNLSVDAAVVAFENGEGFSYRGRRPKYNQHGCWLPSDMHSRTFQVGKRESGKLIRVYEKGHQFGLMADQWVRAEVELRSVNRVIPWESLLKTGDYFAGAYQFCDWLVHHLDKSPVRVMTCTKVAEVSVEAAMRWVSRVVAPTLVQITSAMPDYDWMTTLVLDNVGRRVPRALRGLDHTAVIHGLKKFFNRITPDPVSSHGLASAA